MNVCCFWGAVCVLLLTAVTSTALRRVAAPERQALCLRRLSYIYSSRTPSRSGILSRSFPWLIFYWLSLWACRGIHPLCCVPQGTPMSQAPLWWPKVTVCSLLHPSGASKVTASGSCLSRLMAKMEAGVPGPSLAHVLGLAEVE